MPGTSFFHQARNNAWSNHRLLGVCKNLLEAELTTKRASFSPTILDTLNHTLVVDWYFLDALVGGGRDQESIAHTMQFDDINKLAAVQRDTDARLMAFCAKLDDKAVVRDVTLTRSGDGTIRETVSSVLSHLFNHQTHRRGQVHAMLCDITQLHPHLDEYHLESDVQFRESDFNMLGWNVAGSPVGMAYRDNHE